jgi:carbonic anhydrase/acetyltransferase-like protein (isoleucine patch superfamily)
VVTEGGEVAPGVLAAGAPAREKKRLSGSALRWTGEAADHYQDYRRRYLHTIAADRRT